MSDKTFGVKVSEEMYDKVKNMIEISGISSKEWFEKAVALTAVQDLKDTSGDYKQDLTELEKHTTRIYELVANMIQRANYFKEDAVKGLESKLESKELTISELQNNVKSLKDEIKRVADESKQSQTEKQALNEQVEGLRSTNDTNQALIQEYKEKIDTLSSLVNEYKGFATENTKLKETYIAEKEQTKSEFNEREGHLNSSIEKLKQTVGEQQNKIQSNEKEIESLKINFENQLTQLTNTKDLERERAILEVERIYQEKLQQIHDQYNDKIANLYEKFESNNGKNEEK